MASDARGCLRSLFGVHKDDKVTCERLGVVPRRLRARAEVDFIELAMNLPHAVDRAIQFLAIAVI